MSKFFHALDYNEDGTVNVQDAILAPTVGDKQAVVEHIQLLAAGPPATSTFNPLEFSQHNTMSSGSFGLQQTYNVPDNEKVIGRTYGGVKWLGEEEKIHGLDFNNDGTVNLKDVYAASNSIASDAVASYMMNNPGIYPQGLSTGVVVDTETDEIADKWHAYDINKDGYVNYADISQASTGAIKTQIIDYLGFNVVEGGQNVDSPATHLDVPNLNLYQGVVVIGCTDPKALNYNPAATIDASEAGPQYSIHT
tara:strand:- start:140 stop:892 length:753 start_codon:yes stop_codon:yes gene_type:complete